MSKQSPETGNERERDTNGQSAHCSVGKLGFVPMCILHVMGSVRGDKFLVRIPRSQPCCSPGKFQRRTPQQMLLRILKQ
jgi:hypothetical protein